MDKLNVSAWAGRVTEDTGMISERDAAAIHATLGDGRAPKDGDPVPPLWHWCAFKPTAPNDMLGPDGHPRGGDLLPPVRLPRRMWAGGALEFHAPVHVGDPLTRRSCVRDVVEKDGASGPMVFVTVDHTIHGPRGVAIEERQDIVYLEMPKAYAPPKPRAMPANPVETLEATETLLFRYSALTFNAHRIHYDATYAREVEKYPGLVVHGPLQATLLMRAATRHKGRVPRYFDFRGVHPMFAGSTFDIAMKEDIASLDLWTGQGGHQCMQATAIWMETQ